MRLALLLACVLSWSACVDAFDDAGAMVQPDLSGSLRVFLRTESEEGKVYRLRGVEIDISGAALLTISDRDGIRARESLHTRLPPGQYAVYVRPGFRLMERDAEGRETEVPAELVSPNPVRIHMSELGDDILPLVVRHGERELRFGGGAAVRVSLAKTPDAL
jgi:hypothetical protein